MGTHPIFESDFDCLTDWVFISRIARASLHLRTDCKIEIPMPGIVSEMTEPELAKKKIKKAKKVKVVELDSGVQEDLPKVKKSKKKAKAEAVAELDLSENTQSVKKTKKRKQEDTEQPTKKK